MIEKQKIKVGDGVRYGMSFLIIDEIDGDTLWCSDEDGQDFELTYDQIDIL